MSTTPRSEADRVATYEISLRGKVPESLGSHSTGMSVRSATGTGHVAMRC